ncbi:MAG: hypothetical protein LQ352_007783 [Teloschistes flavicans]|nr:MAG: hypothetical protein LQ352_007783 [Teloschistes flavicans]
MANDEDEQSFKRMWEDAQHSFEQTTKKSLVQHNPSLDDVLKDLEERFDDDDLDKSGKRQRVKQLASNVLKLIQLLGGIAAQGASAVWGPATQCFSAFNLLLDIPVRISRFHDDLASLFAEISTFLNVFKIYQRVEDFAKVDVELKRCAHKLMVLLVDICALSIDYFSGSRIRKIWSDAKVALFEDDSGVKAKLEEFKTLISHQGQISDAVTLEHVLRSEDEQAGSLKKVLDMLKRTSEDTRWKLQEVNEELKDVHNDTRMVAKYVVTSTNQKELQDLIEQIYRKLSVDATAISEIEKELGQIQNDSQESTGSWLEDIGVYKKWADLNSECDPILWLSGESGTGKTHLAFTILNRLRKRFSSIEGNSSMEVSSVVYRFVRNEKRPRDDTIKHSLRFVAAELAKQDIVYMKQLSSYLASIEPSTIKQKSVKDLFGELLASPRKNDISNNAYVLLFDGIDQLSVDEARQLADAAYGSKSSKVRILMTGTSDTLRSCSDLTGHGLDLIHVVKYNLPDIERFVQKGLGDCKVLQGDQEEISRIVARVMEDLPRNAKGNFKHAEQIIEQISDAVKKELTEEEITNIISGKTLKDVQKLINELNDSLNAHEIDQLNELLVWSIYGYIYFSVDQMEAALFMRTQRKPFQPLRKKVEQKYRSILQINSGEYGVVRTNDEFVDFFLESTRERQGATEDAENDPKISMTIKIDRVNQSQVQRFVWDLSEKALLDKFAFTASTFGPASTAKVSANATEAHLIIVKRCFDLLLDDPIQETMALSEYALRWLHVHLGALGSANHKNLLRPAERENIVDSLVNLLQSADTVVQKYLNNNFLHVGRWLDDVLVRVEIINGWLHDSEATKRLGRKERIWLKQVDSEGWLLALKAVARMIARQWLCSRRFKAESSFRWIDEYVQIRDEPSELENSGASERKSDEHQTQDTIGDKTAEGLLPAKARIVRAAEWAEKEADMIKDSLYYERLGQTYLSQNEHDCSIEAFLKAKDLPNSSWTVPQGLAEAYAASDKKDLAVKERELVTNSLRSQESSTGQINDLVINIFDSAMLHKDLGHTAEAIDCLREAIRLDPSDYQSLYELLILLIASNAEPEALTILNEMNAEPAKEPKLTRLGSMFIEMVEQTQSSVDFEHFERFEIIFQVTRYDSLFNAILQTLARTITFKQESTPSSTTTVIQLCLVYGVALAGYSTQEQRLESAMDQWRNGYELGLRSQIEEDWYWASEAATRIFNLHFLKANSPQRSADETESKSTELQTMMERMQMRSIFNGEKLQRRLASFYGLIGKQEAARQLLQNQLKSGIDLLSDDDTGNDEMGYCYIARVLMHTGDHLNALSAWSLWGISKCSSAKEESCLIVCDGRCNKSVSWMDSLWFCKVCDNITFHDECLAKVRKGSLNRYVCSPDHDWLYVPSCVVEYKATGDGNVRIGGEFRDNKRIGGQIVTVEEWLDMIRENWGIEKSTVKA